MEKIDPRLSPEAWGGHLKEEFVLGNDWLWLFNQTRDGVVSTLRFGDLCYCHAREGNWSLIAAAHDGYLGWAKDVINKPSSDAPRVRISALATHIYPVPDMKRPAINWLPMGAWVEDHAQNGDFTQIGANQFVFSKHLTSQGDAVDYALQFLNTPYLWGGGTPHGIDCSGLTQLCYSMAGQAIARDTDQQEASLSPINAREAGRGDLVFWKGHVGILEDHQTLIHATAFAMKTIRENLKQTILRIGEPTRFARVTKQFEDESRQDSV